MYKKESLQNGLRVVTSSMPAMESVSIGLWIGVGGRYEKKSLSGISHLMEHMLFKGTLKRTANDLKEAIEGVGGSFNGFTSEEVTCYLVKLPAKYLELGLDVLSDMVLNPALDPVELEKEKYVILEEIKMYLDLPSQYVFEVLAEAMWPNHPLGQPLTGYVDTVKNFKRKDLVDFSKLYYNASNTAIIAAGKIDHKKIISFAKKTFKVSSKNKDFSYKKVLPGNKGNTIKIFEKPAKQTHFAIGFHSMKRTDKMRYAVQLMNVILGGNMSSRLFDRLREKKALCYEISSSVRPYKETGSLVIHAGVDNEKLILASEEVMTELKDIKKNLVSKNELKRAKEYVKGQLLLALEDTGSRMLWLGQRVLLEGKAPPLKEIIQNVDKVTLEDIRKSANMTFNNKNANFATVGPAKTEVKCEIEEVIKF